MVLLDSQNLHWPGLTTPYGLRRAKVGFGSPSGPVLNTLSLFPAKIFVTGIKKKIVIQASIIIYVLWILLLDLCR